MIILTNINKNYNYIISYFDDYDDNNKYINILSKYIDFILYSSISFHVYEYENFKNYYIRYFYYQNKLKHISYFNYSHDFHRVNGPAWINYENEKIHEIEYFLNGEIYCYEMYLLQIKKLS